MVVQEQEQVRGYYKRGKVRTKEISGREVYYESIKRELNKRLILEFRCDGRLKAKAEGSTRLTYTG